MFIYLISQLFLCCLLKSIKSNSSWYSYDTYQRIVKQAKYDIYSPSNHPFKDWKSKEIEPYLTNLNVKTKIPKKFKEIIMKSQKNTDIIGVKDNLLNYDSMEKYPHCFGNIRDQGKCRANWAFAISSALSTAFCIRKNSTSLTELSSQKLISCGHGSGCNDSLDILGNLMKFYIQFNGISEEKCDPYNLNDGSFIQSCIENRCNAKEVELKTYKANVTFINVKDSSIDSKNMVIRQHIINYGSVVGVFSYYDDFIYYKSGIYRNIENAEKIGVIYLKIYGWGSNNKGEFYWLTENTWSRDWGQNGLIHISFDQMIEYFIVLEPKINNIS